MIDHIIENRNGVRVRTDKIIELTIEEHSQIHKPKNGDFGKIS